MNKKGIVFFIEGETEIEFYRKMIQYLHNQLGKFSYKIFYENIKGITNYKSKINRIFDKKIKNAIS